MQEQIYLTYECKYPSRLHQDMIEYVSLGRLGFFAYPMVNAVLVMIDHFILILAQQTRRQFSSMEIFPLSGVFKSQVLQRPSRSRRLDFALGMCECPISALSRDVDT